MFKFNKSEFRALSAASNSIGQIFFGTAAGTTVFISFDLSKLLVLASELILAIASWYLSLLFAKKGKL